MMMKVRSIFILELVSLCLAGYENNIPNSSTNIENLARLVNEIKTESQLIKSENQLIWQKFLQLEKENDELKLKIKSDKEKYQEMENKIIELDKMTQDNTIEERLCHLEELSKIKVLRTCEELAKHGISTDGLYTIDPDGEMIGYDPIEVFCTFDIDGNVVTEVKHFQEDVIQVQKCETPRCFNQSINYGVPMAQIEALVSLSETCEQTISFGCYLAPLFDNGDELGGWRDRNGNPQYFFNGNHQGEHKCACGETNSCLNDGVTEFECNCDAKLPLWAMDTGIIEAKEILPITEVFYGPLLFDTEGANFSLGWLKCKGSPLIEDKTTSCQTLKKSGSTKSMIYNLKGENSQFPRLAYCDMENSEGYEDPSMETKLGYVLHSPYDQRPDIFSVYENEGSQFIDTYLTFPKSFINDGNVFDGMEFTCRMEGYYDFSFAGTGYPTSNSYIHITVQKNGSDVLKFFDQDKSNANFLVSFNWQMELKAGDKVRLKQSGDGADGFYTNTGAYRIFNGKFIHPL